LSSIDAVERAAALPFPAVILAGGLGRRMGGADKAFVELAGRPLIAHVIARLRDQCAPIAISANGDPARFARFGAPVLADPIADAGPLAGVLAALDFAAALPGAPTPAGDLALTVPVDTPFPPPDLAARLLARMEDAGAAVALAQSGGRVHFACGLWRAELRETLRRRLLAGESRRIEDFARSAGFVTVSWPAGAEDPFANINQPEDLAAAQERISGAGDRP